MKRSWLAICGMLLSLVLLGSAVPAGSQPDVADRAPAGTVLHNFRFVGHSGLDGFNDYGDLTGTTATAVQVQSPPSGDIAPPGPYLLFVLTAGRVPSTGRWIHLA